MRQFKTSMDVYRRIRANRQEMRTARGLRKRDLVKYHNRLVKLYNDLRKEEADEREKAKASDKLPSGD